MEQVFDLREFMIGFWKKGKLIVLLVVVFAILGAGFGWYKFPNDDLIMSSSTATVNTVDATQDATALSSAMTMVNAYLTSDTFYTELLNEISAIVDGGKVSKLFNGDSTPKLDDVKEIIKIQTKGNIVIAEVTATSKEIPVEVAELCIKYITANITKYNSNIVATKLGNEVVNITKQNNDTLLKEVGLFGAVGAVGGLGVSLLFVFFVNVFSVKVKKEDDLKKFKLPILSENPDRAVAVILTTIEDIEHANIALTSTGDADVLEYANELKKALARTEHDFVIVDVRGESYAKRKEITELNNKAGKQALLCCDNVNTSSAAMHVVAFADYVVLCEKRKKSHTDTIENALAQVKNLKTQAIGIILK